ncbi:hypothetical protein D1007_36408 [Hordeum vulgare]|nr:hypothetical protein D1007_36408 [Hordeum vulgare]
MLLWRIWHVRNEVVHSKPAPPVDGSIRFLASYYDSLANFRVDPDANYVKARVQLRSNGELGCVSGVALFGFDENEVRSSPQEPYIGMEFDTPEGDKAHYKAYSLKTGFSMKANTSRRSGYTNELEKQTFCCNKSGKPKIHVFKKLSSNSDDPVDGQYDGSKRAGSSSYKTPSGLVKKRRREFIKQTNCASKMTVKLIGRKWVVIGVVPHHNHKLIDKPSLTKYLRCHKGIPQEEASTVPYSAKSISNMRTSLRTAEANDGDLVETNSYFQQRHHGGNMYLLEPNRIYVGVYGRRTYMVSALVEQQEYGWSMSDAGAALCRSYGRALETELNQLYKSRNKKKKKSATQVQPPASSAPTEVSVGESTATPLRNPPKSSTKGRKRDKRYYSGIELHPKKKTKCAYCKELGHNCATCTSGLIRSA